MDAGPSDAWEARDKLADLREDAADHRELDADERERLGDVRERILDRWEEELAARAAALNLLDPVEEERRRQGSARRARDREQRRADAESRRDAAIERDIQRADRSTSVDFPLGPSHPFEEEPSAALARLASALQEDLPFEEVVRLVLAIAVDTVPMCEAASVALPVGGRLRSAGATVDWAASLDEAQLEHGGPLPDAANGRMVLSNDLRSDSRWPALALLPASLAERSALSIGLVVDDTGQGVLTLYSKAGAPFGAEAPQMGEILAAHAALALRRTLERLTYLAQTEAWQRALASRDMIGQAKGILMEQRGVGADEAFDVLRATSQRLNVKLRDVAEHVVAERRLPDT